jgi:hypothetical protein
MGLAGLTAPAHGWAEDSLLRGSNFDAARPIPAAPMATTPSDLDFVDPAEPLPPPPPPPPASGAANYGKPQIVEPGRKKPPKTAAHPLPPLVSYPTSAEARRRARLDAARAPLDQAQLRPSTATAMPAQLPQKPKPRIDEAPYAPIGVDLGLLRARVYEETSLGYNSNPNQATGGVASPVRGSGFLRQEIGAAGASDWNNHSFAGDLRLGYNDYFTAHSADAPDGAGKFLARIDVTRDTKINVDGNFDLSTQLQSSPNLYNGGASTALQSRPIIADYGGGLGATHDFNRLELTLRGSVERTYWGNAKFADGSTQYLSRNSYDDYGLTLRAAYEATPGVKPFVQAFVDKRDHDSLYDNFGYMRNSTGVAVTAGSTFEISRLLTGQVSAGYGDRNYQDYRLADLRGAVFDTSLVWSATPLTTVTLRGVTTMDETNIPGSPGTINRNAGIEIAHALMRNLTITAAGSMLLSNYVDANLRQDLMQVGLKAEYSLTRSIVIKGSFTHQRMLSSAPGSDYTANIFMVGLRLQQ